VLDRDALIMDLRTNVVEVTFNKVSDGSKRVMRCTLMKQHLPESYRENIEEETQEKNFHKENPEVVAAWDVQKGGWRSFRMDSVQYVQIVDGY
jgi:hypothetical protein